jgi:hypothetical protein
MVGKKLLKKAIGRIGRSPIITRSHFRRTDAPLRIET